MSTELFIEPCIPFDFQMKYNKKSKFLITTVSKLTPLKKRIISPKSCCFKRLKLEEKNK